MLRQDAGYTPADRRTALPVVSASVTPADRRSHLNSLFRSYLTVSQYPSQFSNPLRGAVVIIVLAFAGGQALALDVTWNFGGATPLESTDGSRSISYYDPFATGWGPANTQFGIYDEFGIRPFPDGASGDVMSFPATTPTQGYRVDVGAGVTAAYTMIWDYYSPIASDGKWRALLQTSASNANDGEFFIRNAPSGGVGINGIYAGSIAPDSWNRIVMTRDAGGAMNKYVNGYLVGSQAATGTRFELDPYFYILTDEDNETQPGYLSSFRFADRVLSSQEVRELGNVSSAGALSSGPEVPMAPAPLFGRTLVMAHRGGGFLAPENTLAAVAKGFEAGSDVIEIDVHLTSDGHAVVFHDSTLNRTTNGSGPIANLTLAQLKQLDAGSWFAPEYAGEKVPTLTELLEFVDGRARVLLDVKVPASQALRDAIARSMTESGTSLDDIWVWPSSSVYSSDPRFGDAEVQLLSSVPSDLSDANLQALKASGVDGLSVTHDSITQQVVDAFHRNQMYVDSYTVNDVARLQELIAMGVDSIETDRPDLMADLVYAGDYNLDGAVNAADYTVWRDALGNLVPPGTMADANANGRVDALDYQLWRRHFGKSAADFSDHGQSKAAIPEPTSLVLVGCIASTLTSLRRFAPN